MHCLSCKYDLRQLTEHRCPECGRAFDPDDPKTFETLSSALRRQLRRAAIWFAGIWAFCSLTYMLAIVFLSGIDEPFLEILKFSAISGIMCMLLMSPLVLFGLMLKRRNL